MKKLGNNVGPPSTIAKLVNITTISLGFMVLVTNWLHGVVNQLATGGADIAELSLRKMRIYS